MIKRLVKHDSGAALIIDAPIMEALGLANDGIVELSMDGKRLIIEAEDVRARKVDILPILERMQRRYSRLLQRLTDEDR
jgi:antitoxin component of MazEF toxin-antitoxin module